MKKNNPIKLGRFCNGCGLPSMSCVCIQKIDTTERVTGAKIKKSLKKFLEKESGAQKNTRQIDADILIEAIQKEKLELIRAMNLIGASDAIKHLLPQHYDKITKMVEEMAAKKD